MAYWDGSPLKSWIWVCCGLRSIDSSFGTFICTLFEYKSDDTSSIIGYKVGHASEPISESTDGAMQPVSYLQSRFLKTGMIPLIDKSRDSNSEIKSALRKEYAHSRTLFGDISFFWFVWIIKQVGLKFLSRCLNVWLETIFTKTINHLKLFQKCGNHLQVTCFNLRILKKMKFNQLGKVESKEKEILKIKNKLIMK